MTTSGLSIEKPSEVAVLHAQVRRGRNLAIHNEKWWGPLTPLVQTGEMFASGWMNGNGPTSNPAILTGRWRRRTSALAYRSISDPAILKGLVATIRALADTEKEALGFLPGAAYEEAIARGRVVAMMSAINGRSELIGFALFSGVFPNAKIQQVVVAPAHRRQGVASALIDEVLSRHEARGYLRVTAAVADDLPIAQAFYERNGFGATRERAGGSTRGRMISLRARDLGNEHLLSILERPSAGRPEAVDLGLRARGAGVAPLYAIDLNVLFDAVKNRRERAPLAQRVIGAGLAHRLRLVTTSEFVTELERNTAAHGTDPMLELARQLPRLPEVDQARSDALADVVQEIVFGQSRITEGRLRQAVSDARHLAKAALARASGFITSDGQILDARGRLMDELGIDVLSLDEFAAMLDIPLVDADWVAPPTMAGLTPTRISRNTAKDYLARQTGVAVLTQALADADAPVVEIEAMMEGNELVGLAARLRGPAIDAPARLFLHVIPGHVRADLVAEALLASQCRRACVEGPILVEAEDVPGQSAVRRAALTQGFVARRGGPMVKLAIGKPLTPRDWPSVARFTRRRTGLGLPETPPSAHQVLHGMSVTGPDGREVTVSLSALEEAIGPTIIAWPGRVGALIPIGRAYADDLLGTALQGNIFGPQQAALGSRRTYLNTPRAASALLPGMPILFYESMRSGGRGAVVAAARVVDATVTDKARISTELMRRSVVDDVDPLSATGQVLATTFEGVLPLPVPVPWATLRTMSAVGKQNLVSVTPISGEALAMILEWGWPDDRTR